jgi:regulator of protease activity HflC (stomatin/prohibitin superfamily)
VKSFDDPDFSGIFTFLNFNIRKSKTAIMVGSVPGKFQRRNIMDGFMVIIIVLALLIFSAIKILREYERGVIFLLGKFWKVKGPGLIIVVPGIQKMVKVSLRTVVMDVPPQDIITKDNVTVKVNAVVYFRVIDPRSAIIEVEDYLYATSQLSQTTLRSVLGQSQLDDLLSRRDEINEHLQQVIDQQTEPWGVKVANVEVKNVDLPQEMQRALAKQAEAERERRAKVINAQGEFEASLKLSEAADQIGAHPPALQLRFLQTLVDMSTERSTTTFVPIPMDLFDQFQKTRPKKDEG